MAKRAKKQEQKRRRIGRRAALAGLLCCALALGGLLGYMGVQARAVHLCSADVYLADLPAGLDGVTLLLVSDLNIRNGADAARCRSIFSKLRALQPDVLLLGGDYSARTLGEVLNGAPETQAKAAALDFLSGLASFQAPLGKFAVLGERDGDEAALRTALAAGGVELLADECAVIARGGGEMVIAGLTDTSRQLTPYSQIGRYFTGDECVVALAHNPTAYVGVRVAEAKNGGAWADLVLSGHTLGGQICAFGRTLHTLPEAEARCLAGWFYTDDLPLLVSRGLGCDGAMLRLGAQSEVWLLTLRRPETVDMTALPDL